MMTARNATAMILFSLLAFAVGGCTNDDYSPILPINDPNKLLNNAAVVELNPSTLNYKFKIKFPKEGNYGCGIAVEHWDTSRPQSVDGYYHAKIDGILTMRGKTSLKQIITTEVDFLRPEKNSQEGRQYSGEHYPQGISIMIDGTVGARERTRFSSSTPRFEVGEEYEGEVDFWHLDIDPNGRYGKVWFLITPHGTW